MARLVLDTNILVSALGWVGKPRQVFELCIKGKHTLLLSLELLEELITVLKRPKFDFIPIEKKAQFLKDIVIIAELVKPQINLDIVPEDKADNKVVECAIAGRADFIVSGDAHLLGLKQYSKVKIVSAEEFLAESRKKRTSEENDIAKKIIKSLKNFEEGKFRKWA